MTDPDDGALASSVRATELGRALRAALAAHATPERADRMLHVALERAGCARFPTSPGALRDFVRRDLRDVVEEALGADAAASIAAGIEPVLTAMASATRITRSTAPAPRSRGPAEAVVAILSDDPALEQALAASLPREIDIQAPRSVPELRELALDRRCVVLIDVRVGVSPTLARLGPHLGDAPVLAWGDDRGALASLRSWLGAKTTLMSFPGEQQPHDLALLLETELEAT